MNFHILKPQPSPKSSRIALSNITNTCPSFNKNVTPCTKHNKKCFNSQYPEQNKWDFLNKSNQNISKKYCLNRQQSNLFPQICNYHQNSTKKYQSLKSKILRIQQNKQQNVLCNPQKKRKYSFNLKKNQDSQQGKIQRQSFMLREIKQFIYNASQISKKIKQEKKNRQNKINIQMIQKQNLKKQIQKERDRVLEQIQQKYAKQLLTIQTEIIQNQDQISLRINELDQNIQELQQILTDIQTNIGNLNNFSNSQFRNIMDYYWKKVQIIQVPIFKINRKPALKTLSLKKTQNKIIFSLQKQDNKYGDMSKNCQQNVSELENQKTYLSKIKSKSKLELFTQQLKKAICGLQRQCQKNTQCADQVNNQTSRFNNSQSVQYIQSEEQTSSTNKQSPQYVIGQQNPKVNNQFQYSFKKPILNKDQGKNFFF